MGPYFGLLDIVNSLEKFGLDWIGDWALGAAAKDCIVDRRKLEGHFLIVNLIFWVIFWLPKIGNIGL